MASEDAAEYTLGEGGPDKAWRMSKPNKIPYALNNTEEHMKTPAEKTERILINPLFRKGYIASSATLCLGIMGGAVLPVAWAFSITGIASGLVIAMLVAWANVFTSDLLIRQCYKSGASDYEEIAYATGGTIWLLITQVSILVLAFGTIIGGMQQTAEAAVIGMQTVWNEDVPDWLLYKDDTGYLPMVVLTLLFAFPLCMVKQMRALEYAGMFGFVIVMWLMLVVISQSIAAGLPAIGNGEFQKGGFDSMDGIGQAVSVFGFAFYIQPIMMPLLAEMPGAPRHQARILSWAMRFAVVAFAFTVYVLVGFFGAAWYGVSTEGNILQNKLMGGGVPQGILNLFMAVYLSFVVPTLEIPARLILNNWLPGDKSYLPGVRHVFLSTFIIFSCLAVALFWQAGSENLLVITASTGVFMASYVLPIGNHFLLYFNLAKCQREAEHLFKLEMENSNNSHFDGHPIPKFVDSQGVPVGEALPPIGPNSLEEVGKPGVLTYGRKFPSGFLPMLSEVTTEIILPLLIVGIGAFSSGVSLWVNFK